MIRTPRRIPPNSNDNSRLRTLAVISDNGEAAELQAAEYGVPDSRKELEALATRYIAVVKR